MKTEHTSMENLLTTYGGKKLDGIDGYIYNI